MSLPDGKGGTIRGQLVQCKGPSCRQMIVMVFNPKTGKTAPYNVQPDPKLNKAVSHFATCVDVERFRQPKWV